MIDLSTGERFFEETRTVMDRRLDVFERILPIDIQIEAYDEVSDNIALILGLSDIEFDCYLSMDENPEDSPYQTANDKYCEIVEGLQNLEESKLDLPVGFSLDDVVELGRVTVSRVFLRYQEHPSIKTYIYL